MRIFLIFYLCVRKFADIITNYERMSYYGILLKIFDICKGDDMVLDYKTTLCKPKRKKFYKPKKLPCPACEFDRLIDTGQFTCSKTYLPGEEGYLDADYYQKCAGCKLEIGIQKIK